MQEVTEGTNDLGNHRTLTLENNKIHFKRTDPYGFWTVNYDKGQVPVSLRGHYTSYDKAAQAVEGYLANLPKEPEKKVVKA